MGLSEKLQFFKYIVTLKIFIKMDQGASDDLLDYLKLDADHHEKIASLIPQETWYEVIRYGLYVGAVFQFVCIMAVILLPEKEGVEGDMEASCSDDETSRAGSPSHCNQGKKNRKKHDKKKKQL